MILKHYRSSSAPVDMLFRDGSYSTMSSIESDDKTVVNDGSLRRSASDTSKVNKRWTEQVMGFSRFGYDADKRSTASLFSSSASSSSTTDISAPYTIFSKSRKTAIVLLASIAAFFAPFSVNSYFPAMNMIEQNLSITSQQVNLTVTVFMIFQAISPSFWSSLADSRGRRPVYLSTLIVYITSCIGLALVNNYACLLVLRMLQAFGASSVIAIGAGTIADITHPAERGGYIGWYSLGWNLGPVIGPAVGGCLSQYLGWRSIFWTLAGVCFLHWLVLVFFLPETLRSLVGNGSGYANPTPSQWWRQRKQQNEKSTFPLDEKHHLPEPPCSLSRKVGNALLVPFKPLMYAKEKDVLILLVYYSFQYAACYAVTTTIPYLFSDIYHLTELTIGISYLANGTGCIVGSILQGSILNRDYRRMRARVDAASSSSKSDADLPIEHARLRTLWVHAILFNIALVVYGWCLHLRVHIAIILSLHFILGFTSQAIFNAIQTLLVDLFPDRSASITATNNIFRCLFGAAATTGVLPGIQSLGVGWLFSLVSGVLLLSRIPMIFELKYGSLWRRQREEREERV